MIFERLIFFFYTKLRFTKYGKIIHCLIGLWPGPDRIFTKCRNTKSRFHCAVRKSEGKKGLLGRFRHRQGEYCIKMNLKEIEHERADWISLFQDRV
jgi:hypothetical protein